MDKIGRNTPCPCGSGKKYKKCCLIRDENRGMDLVDLRKKLFETSEFPQIESRITLLQSIFSEYNFKDLLIAIYCINISLDNRSALENLLTLNSALLLQESYGTNTICNYEEFVSFFKRIEKKLQVSPMEDYTIEDFGEVKISWKDEVYNVIIGTGHNQVFGMLQFLPYLAEILEKENELKQLLDYTSDTIEFFKNENSSSEEEHIKYLVPSKKLFYRTIEYFDIQLEKNSFNSVEEILKNDSDMAIEKTHFMTYKGQTYPLYNTSILVDIYDIWIKKLDEKQNKKLVNGTIHKILNDIYQLQDDESVDILFPSSIVQDGKFISKTPYAFFATTKKGAVLAINESNYTDEDLEIELDNIKRLHVAGNLHISEVISKTGNGQYRGIGVSSSVDISIILFNDFTNISEYSMILGERDSNYFRCSALDLVYLLVFMDNFEEVYMYLNQDRKDEYVQIMGYGGMASHFLFWKEQAYLISRGAVKFNMISLPHDIDVSYVWDYYKEKLSDYPWGIDDFMFKTPFLWNIKSSGSGYYEYVYKITKDFGGMLKRFKNKCTIFFTHNLKFFIHQGFTDESYEKIRLIDDLNSRKFKYLERAFGESSTLSNRLINLLYIPFEYAKDKRGMDYIKDNTRKYVYSDMHVNQGNIYIRYSINIENLYKDIEESEDRSIEANYLIELLKPIEKVARDDYQRIVRYLEEDMHLKKEVDVFSVKLDYYWASRSLQYNVEKKAYMDVRKNIAKYCNQNGIHPGKYVGRDATSIIRIMQSGLIKSFEDEVAKYKQEDLHYTLLSIYSTLVHSVNINKKRFNAFDNVDEEIIKEINNTTISIREEEKHNIRSLQYLIETNLNLGRQSNTLITQDELEFLLAFANWLVVLQDNADLSYNSKRECHVEVDSEFVVDVIMEDDVKLENRKLRERTYHNQDYIIKGDTEDTQFIENAMEAFKLDTGVDFIDMMSFVEYLQLSFLDYDYEEIKPNVIKVNQDSLVQNFGKCLTKSITRKEILNIIQFLTADKEKFKLWKGEIRAFLPINERENRDNRFDVKPLVKNYDDIIFSPSVMKELHNKWKYGLMDFYLPYEIGLKNTTKVLELWKKRYEDLMVYDIRDIFYKCGFNNVWVNAELYSLDKEHNHPKSLGDYDVFVVDEKKSEIWLIESKVLSKVGSIHEMYMQQYNFFLNHKYDEKFQRRIDYMVEHYKEVLRGLKLDCKKNYKIRAYMITNKILFSRYKNISYPIISIHELNQLLSEN